MAVSNDGWKCSQGQKRRFVFLSKIIDHLYFPEKIVLWIHALQLQIPNDGHLSYHFLQKNRMAQCFLQVWNEALKKGHAVRCRGHAVQKEVSFSYSSRWRVRRIFKILHAIYFFWWHRGHYWNRSLINDWSWYILTSQSAFVQWPVNAMDGRPCPLTSQLIVKWYRVNWSKVTYNVYNHKVIGTDVTWSASAS